MREQFQTFTTKRQNLSAFPVSSVVESCFSERGVPSILARLPSVLANQDGGCASSSGSLSRGCPAAPATRRPPFLLIPGWWWKLCGKRAFPLHDGVPTWEEKVGSAPRIEKATLEGNFMTSLASPTLLESIGTPETNKGQGLLKRLRDLEETRDSFRGLLIGALILFFELCPRSFPRMPLASRILNNTSQSYANIYFQISLLILPIDYIQFPSHVSSDSVTIRIYRLCGACKVQLYSPPIKSDHCSACTNRRRSRITIMPAPIRSVHGSLFCLHQSEVQKTCEKSP